MGHHQTPLSPEHDPEAPPEVQENVNARLVCKAIGAMLLELETQSSKRVKYAEDLMSQVADAIKEFNRDKVNLTKKNFDYGMRYHQQIASVNEEMEKVAQLT